MTLIVYKQESPHSFVMVSDTRVFLGSHVGSDYCLDKIVVLRQWEKDMCVIGFSGTLDVRKKLIDWVDTLAFLDGAIPPKVPKGSDFDLMVWHNKIMYKIEPSGSYCLGATPALTLGCGFKVAMGALQAGLRPRDVVPLTHQHDTGVGPYTQEIKWNIKDKTLQTHTTVPKMSRTK